MVDFDTLILTHRSNCERRLPLCCTQVPSPPWWPREEAVATDALFHQPNSHISLVIIFYKQHLVEDVSWVLIFP